MALTLHQAISPLMVQAHAELLGSNPAPGEALDDPPLEAQLWFTEPVVAGLSDVSLLDDLARPIPGVRTAADPDDSRQVRVVLPELKNGVFTISWSALSAVDGHVDRGLVSFSIGALAPADSEPLVARADPWFWSAVAVRAAGFLASMLVIGISLVNLVATSARAPFSLSWLRFAAIMVIAATLAELLIQASGARTLQSVDDALAAIREITFETRYGLLWIIRALLGLAVVGLTFWARSASGKGMLVGRWAALALSLGLVLSHVSVSHLFGATTGEWAGAMVVALHLAAVSVWLCSLLALTRRAWSRRSGEPEVSAGLAGPIQGLAAAVIVITGIIQALVLVGAGEALVSTVYGRVLLLKLALVVAVSLLVSLPRLKSLRPAWALPRAHRVLAVELVLGLLIVMVTGLLVTLPPAWQTYQQTARRQPIETAITQSGSLWKLRLAPGRVGLNELRVQSAQSRPETVAGRALLTYLDGDVPTLSQMMDVDADGALTLRGNQFSLAGRWLIELIVGGADAGQQILRFTVNVPGAGSPLPPPPLLQQDLITPSRVVAMGLMGLGLGLFAFVARATGLRNLEGGGLAVATIVIASLGLYVALRPEPGAAVNAFNARASVNPYPATEESIGRGLDVYAAQCAGCHGERGRGDGFQTLSQGQRLTDLQVHLSAGHTDGDVFFWMSRGIGGSAMPAFADVLSEEDRWHVINAIRAFSADPDPRQSPGA